MDLSIEEVVQKLHAPLDLTDPIKKGIQEFPKSLYVQRLDDVFERNWSASIESASLWGFDQYVYVIEAEYPYEEFDLKRHGFFYSSTDDTQMFVSACEMLGIGSAEPNDVLACTRKLNEQFGFDWDYQVSQDQPNNAFICRIEVASPLEETLKRAAIGQNEKEAFIKVCSLFGVEP